MSPDPAHLAVAAVARARALLDDPRAAADAVLAEAALLCPVPAPPLAEDARVAWVLGRVPETGVDGAGNVRWVVPGAGGGPPVVVAAHLDTVFAAPAHAPAAASPGRLAAPGIGDNTVGVAAALALGRALAGAEPHRDVVICLTRGEEGRGDLAGARAAVAALSPLVLLAVEGHFLDRVSCAAVGSVRWRARFRGPGGHSWGDRGRPSATHALCRAGARLAALEPGADAAASVGLVAGGTSVNALAAEAHLELDLRAVEPAALDALEAGALAALRAGAAEEGAALELTEIGRRPAGRLPPGHPLPELLRAVRAEVGLPPADESPVSTDANAALGAGVPAAALGITRGGGMHTPAEWIETAPVADGLLQLVAATLALAAAP